MSCPTSFANSIKVKVKVDKVCLIWVLIADYFFSRFCIKPRILQGISNVDMSLLLFGERISMPICIAPVGVQGMANAMAEMASAQGIQQLIGIMVVKC